MALIPSQQPQGTNHEARGTLSGVAHSAQPLLLSELTSGKHGAAARLIVHVASHDRDMEMLAQCLPFFAPGVEVLTFPAWDCLPYDRASPQAAIMAKRMQVLSALANPLPTGLIVLTTANAILQKLPPKTVMQSASLTLRPGQTIALDVLVRFLSEQGYRRAGKAMEPGEFALRGGIVDIVPAGGSDGVRMDFFGDEIESLKPYDPLSQLSQGTLASLSLHPVSEVILNPENCERFRSGYRELFGAVGKDDPLYESIAAGRAYIGMEHWLPLFYEQTATLLDYCPGALVTMDAQAEAAITERFEAVLEYYEARTIALGASSKKNSNAFGALYNPLPPERLFLMEAAWENELVKHPAMHFSPFADAASTTLHYRPALAFSKASDQSSPFDQLKARVDAAAASGKAMLLACYSNGSCERLFTLLMERGFHCLRIEQWQAMKDVRGKTVALAVLPLESGFETDKVIVLSEQDVLGERIARAANKKKKSDVFLQEAANFAEGELVVHKEHGIGRFAGLVTLSVQGASHDCLKLMYDGDDKLFLPVENIEMVSRFGLDEEGAKLDKLGGASWQARKARLKERITIAAEALLKTAAERAVKSAIAIDAPAGSYEEFCARFPYLETEDQERSIGDVLADLGSGKPMDRLICGDVGFGKTEVALRAAFVVASRRIEEMKNWRNEEKKDSSIPQFPSSSIPFQVAVIVPTTLLARQHYRNFKQRFEGFPVVIRQLSRMVSAKEQKETREQLAEGKVDIVIGTHALLAKTIAFKNLGLVIVDEEQHFGVGQKEKLKTLKSDVHVLTLTATPIPRTLQMALTGVRDLSLITTPPVDRLAVRSFVLPYDPVVLREALLREQHRGGKTFLVCPRIKDIAELKTRLAELAPEIKIAVAHGQMAASELDTVMNDFYDGKYDALLSTAIIESGLDIPAANTMLIFNAHMFGLAQLYQLRGRVGRAKTRAYAYFVLPHHRELTKNAMRRLEVMQTLDTLGAGFTLASHDMDIRGFGNLVGEEQYGHIREVGIELYQQMLEEAVAALKVAGDRKQETDAVSDAQNLTPDTFSPAINLGLSVLIPETYVGDLGLRLGLYKRVADMQSEDEIGSFAAELVDRFGPMPEETQHLIAILGLKILCKKAGIARIDAGPKGAVIAFHNNQFANPEKLLAYIDRNARTLKARPDQKLVLTQEWKDDAEKMTAIKKLAGEIGGLVGLS
jgi:transcription-repair coupling factor (superfamily II helicase)